MWTISKVHAEASSFKHYSKRHPREFAACFANLERAVDSLTSGLTLDQLGSTHYFASEGDGLFRIGQTGVRHPHESRLYVYIVLSYSVLYVLTIGDKSTQKADIARCKALIKSLQKNGGEQS